MWDIETMLDGIPSVTPSGSHTEQTETKTPHPGQGISKEKIRLQIARKALATLNNPAIEKTAAQELELMSLIERCTHKEKKRKPRRKKKEKPERKSPFA